jgi:hypothetical protein
LAALKQLTAKNWGSLQWTQRLQRQEGQPLANLWSRWHYLSGLRFSFYAAGSELRVKRPEF